MIEPRLQRKSFPAKPIVPAVLYLDLPPLWPSAPYGPMPKPYHPCYTNVNPAEEARKYTSAEVRCRKVRLIYDWFPPEREAESWLRIVPYRFKKGEKEGSWIVRYFEFHAGIAPLPRVGFIGDLWISWGASDPSIWFKLEEMKWERWGGCMSSVRAVSLFANPSPISRSYRLLRI